MYQFFKKDWQKECQEHASIAEGTPFVANITDQFTVQILIGDSPIECHVAVLENLVGPTLSQVLDDPANHQLTPRMAAQIAADLFEILHLFVQRRRNHNDLHAGNVIVNRLPSHNPRTNAIEPAIRAVAIDLGSVLDADRSGEHEGKSIGDQHQIAAHIARLAAAVQGRKQSDLDYRIAGVLLGLAEHLTPATAAQRVMTVDDAEQALRAGLSAIDDPWRQPLSLHRFGDAYNAQALESWHVPELWFDPDDKWLKRTTARGPQVITGMRGCGKTMLLRALHFHARAAQAAKEGAGSDTQLKRLDDDRFIGLYASCQKLLDPQHHRAGQDVDIPLPFERLYVAYVRDAIRVLRHLRSISDGALLASIDVLLRDALKPLAVDITQLSPGERPMEQFLIDLQFRLAEGEQACAFRMAPAEAFGYLASVLQAAAPAFSNKYVLYLLDDVSTRYLRYELVRDVISRLLFQHPNCAFRITTEAQALHRVLLSPGGSTPADPSRDYEEFDLGNEVYRLLQEGSTKQNMEFVSEILRRRGKQFQDELYRRQPLELLGDVSLQQIAHEIAQSSASSPARKRVYRGLRAVQAVCVGDLGDVVKLYEKILMRADAAEATVAAEKQCDCFLEHSAGLMHFLNRRDEDGRKKSLALSFAQAAGELLQRSARASGGKGRLRQYTKLYVRVDAGPDFNSVVNDLLALLDAGVFVYDGGVPRTKTRDSDPVLQFKLSFRKMLGLASFIGIADRDRFELSGENLRKWLRDPASAKDILVESESRNGDVPGDERPDSTDEDSDRHTIGAAEEKSDRQPVRSSSLSAREAHQLSLVDTQSAVTHRQMYPPALGLSVAEIDLSSLSQHDVGTVVLAQGFEERAYESARRILSVVHPRRVLLVHYSDDQGARIQELLQAQSLDVQRVDDYEQMSAQLREANGGIVIDTSGLSKPYLFVATRDLLRLNRNALLVHTLAEQYFPSNEDLEARGITMNSEDSVILSSMEEVFLGEKGPYKLNQVHHEVAEPERWLALIASTSPKNDRLLHLLDARTYDAARIFVPPATTVRRRVARAAAQLSASAADSNVALIEVETNDLKGALENAERVYNDLYYGSGANVEIGLTGSKMHAVAFGAVAAAARISAAWYVYPQSYEMERFTKGARETRCFRLTYV